MGLKVETETTCDRCKKLDVRDGTLDTAPPGWATLVVSVTNRYRSDGDTRTDHVLCDGCVSGFGAFMLEDGTRKPVRTT